MPYLSDMSGVLLNKPLAAVVSAASAGAGGGYTVYNSLDHLITSPQLIHCLCFTINSDNQGKFNTEGQTIKTKKD